MQRKRPIRPVVWQHHYLQHQLFPISQDCSTCHPCCLFHEPALNSMQSFSTPHTQLRPPSPRIPPFILFPLPHPPPSPLPLPPRHVPGREFCVAVAGRGPSGAFAFSSVERVLASDEKVGSENALTGLPRIVRTCRPWTLRMMH